MAAKVKTSNYVDSLIVGCNDYSEISYLYKTVKELFSRAAVNVQS